MSPRRSTNAFEEALIQHEAILEVQPADNAMVFTVLGSLEQTGLQLIGAGELKTQRFAEAMHGVFSKVADIEMVPPANDQQRALIAGKVSIFAAMAEAAAPKPRRVAGKTQTEKLPTDKPKR